MPRYLAPGVFVEEVAALPRSLEGVSTSVTGFVGPARCGPCDAAPGPLTSLAEFERLYGDGLPLVFSDAGAMPHYLWHAARAFFAEGGKLLQIARVFLPRTPGDDGCARAQFSADDAAATTASARASVIVRARFPGAAGNGTVRVELAFGPDLAAALARDPLRQTRVVEHDLVWIAEPAARARRTPTSTTRAAGRVWRVARAGRAGRLEFRDVASTAKLPLDRPGAGAKPREVRVLSLVVRHRPGGQAAEESVWRDLAPDPRHRRGGVDDSFTGIFGESPLATDLARRPPLVVTAGARVTTGERLLRALFDWSDFQLARPLRRSRRTRATPTQTALTPLTGGNDGLRPDAAAYRGTTAAAGDTPDAGDAAATRRTGLALLEAHEDIAIVAAPGCTHGLETAAYGPQARQILADLVAHAEQMRFRVAVLDCGDGQTPAQVRALRAGYDSRQAALYYPWVRVADPVTGQPLLLPPSGFVAGIYVRTDTERGVHQAPANAVITSAIGLEREVTAAEQDGFNPEGINCLRFFTGRGFRLWGARTLSRDVEWKYVNVRRLLAYLERSIERGTPWAVFEPNAEPLWAKVRGAIENFLFRTWQAGAFPGVKPEQAFFVRCDRSTMTQHDLDDGRLVCLVGVAPVRPAEFVIFRIGQWTADRSR